jgi:hypothetical protein
VPAPPGAPASPSERAQRAQHDVRAIAALQGGCPQLLPNPLCYIYTPGSSHPCLNNSPAPMAGLPGSGPAALPHWRASWPHPPACPPACLPLICPALCLPGAAPWEPLLAAGTVCISALEGCPDSGSCIAQPPENFPSACTCLCSSLSPPTPLSFTLFCPSQCPAKQQPAHQPPICGPHSFPVCLPLVLCPDVPPLPARPSFLSPNQPPHRSVRSSRCATP